MEQEQGRSLDEAFDAIIDAWLIERQALLTQFVALPQMSVTEDVIHELHSLCEAMVDYSSRGHFNVYEQLLMHIAEHNNLHAPHAHALLGKIHDTTDKIIVFDDEYGAVDKMSIQDVGHFSGRLSRLGEVLTERFNHEDELMGLVQETLS
ncbi:sigma D regulator [Oceanospirillaceae bacterium]|nr:sigma D regulator [Oceanospirillaceae bacterium]MDC1350888.1 sigma D regulator [Oceanospirillaceae bacterium]